MTATTELFRGILFTFVLWMIVLILALCSCTAKADNDPWDATDKVLFGSFLVMEAIDIAQTNRIRHIQTCSQIHPDSPPICFRKYYETNPLYGSDPNMAKVIGVKVIDATVIGIVGNMLPSVARKAAFAGADIVQFTVIHHNYTIGLKWGF